MKSKEPVCVVCKKRKAVNIPFTDSSGKKIDCLINMGACNNAKCILIRQRETM